MIFIGIKGRSSAEIRGRQIANRMGGKYFDSDDRRLLDVNDEVVIFVRSFYPAIAKVLKERGCKIGYDLLDKPCADHHAMIAAGRREDDVDWSIYINDHREVDFYIVNNDLIRDNLKRLTSKQIYVIPHHTVNFEKAQRGPIDLNSDVTVGYVGLEDQSNVGPEILRWCERRNITFLQGHPTTREDVVRLIKKIDIGIIYVNPSPRIDSVLRYKPNTKLSNFQSFGIPTIACGYKSFEQWGGGAWLRADSENTVTSLLESLIDRGPQGLAMREAIRNDSLIVGGMFHIDGIIDRFYRPLEKR